MADAIAKGVRRGVGPEGLREWFNVARRALLSAPLDDEAFEQVSDRFSEPERCVAAVDDAGNVCGSAYAFSTTLSVPGGQVSAAAVTAVGVLPTHRRQGHLTRMMQAQLDDVAQRGEALAVLVSAEYPIYGRYGYGVATEACGIHVDAAALRGLPDDGFVLPSSGHVALLDNDAFYEVLPVVYNRAVARNAGHMERDDSYFRLVAGLAVGHFGEDSSKSSKVAWCDAAGEVQALASYTVEQNWQGNRPLGTLTAFPLIAATDEGERELLRFLVNVDWIAAVQVNLRPIDDAAPLWLRDGRVAELVDRSDHVWARIMDVPAALSARRYQARGEIVFEVVDPMGYASGRFLLEMSPDVVPDGETAAAHPARCVPTDAEPDLTVPVGALGAAYLGGVSWSRLAAAGQVDEHSPGTVSHASAAFTTPRAPWCAMTF